MQPALSRRTFLSLAATVLPGAACAHVDPRDSHAPHATETPRPLDDGAARHLPGLELPDVALPSTAGGFVHLAKLTSRRFVLYAYPRTGRPGAALPDGWNDIPGARGCTAEACAFRDHHRELAQLGADVFAVSTQSTEYQKEMVARLLVPFEVLSDERLELATRLSLPTFAAGGMTLLRRLTLVVTDHRIEHVFYPVFPVESHADEVIAWLAAHPL